MRDGLEQFKSHLLDPAPGFRCYAAGDRTESLLFLARVKHLFREPASPAAIYAASKWCRSNVSLIELFKLHDGLILYRDTKSEAAGIEFFPLADWERATEEMRSSMIAMGFDADDMPDWFHQGVVFGQVPESANFFVLQATDSDGGQIYYCDHDAFEPDSIASSFDDLLKKLVDDPAAFLMQCGCYTRYSDRKSPTQWIPKEYA